MTLPKVLRTAFFCLGPWMSLALSSQPAMAQATYIYTGQNLTGYTAPYTSSSHVTATLQLGNWLPPSQTCVNLTTLPGFQLIMSDGVQTTDSTFTVDYANVGTAADGLPAVPWDLRMGAEPRVQYDFILTSYFPYRYIAPCFPLQIYDLDGTDPVDLASLSLLEGGRRDFAPVSWSYPPASALTVMLQNKINLESIGPGSSLPAKLNQIGADITANSIRQACADLAAFASEVLAQTGKKITPDQSTFILRTVQIMESNATGELNCGG